jgi:hypothetical protein
LDCELGGCGALVFVLWNGRVSKEQGRRRDKEGGRR